MTQEINIIDSLAGVDVKVLSKKEKNLIYKVAEQIAAYDLGVIESIEKPDDAVRYLQNRYRNVRGRALHLDGRSPIIRQQIVQV